MFKVTPNPPHTDPLPYDACLDPKKLQAAADRALSHYIGSGTPKTQISSRKPYGIFVIGPLVDDETLLVQACTSFASASVMASDIANSIDPQYRDAIVALQQVIMMGELAVNRVLDNYHPPG